MATTKPNVFKYLDYRAYLRDVIQHGPRGLQTKMAKAAECQATYLIRVMKESAHLTEDQAFRIAGFLGHPTNETHYFMNLIRYERASDRELKRYYRSQLESYAKAQKQDVLERLDLDVQETAKVQIQMFSSWHASTIHLSTACPQLRTARAIAKQLDVDVELVKRTLQFLEEHGFVSREGDQYTHTGQSLRIPRESPLHLTIQHSRRELALRYLDKQQEDSLHFSSVFATTREHLKEIQEEFSTLIERTHRKLHHLDSEEVGMIVLDFFQVS